MSFHLGRAVRRERRLQTEGKVALAEGIADACIQEIFNRTTVKDLRCEVFRYALLSSLQQRIRDTVGSIRSVSNEPHHSIFTPPPNPRQARFGDHPVTDTHSVDDIPLDQEAFDEIAAAAAAKKQPGEDFDPQQVKADRLKEWMEFLKGEEKRKRQEEQERQEGQEHQEAREQEHQEEHEHREHNSPPPRHPLKFIVTPEGLTVPASWRPAPPLTVAASITAALASASSTTQPAAAAATHSYAAAFQPDAAAVQLDAAVTQPDEVDTEEESDVEVVQHRATRGLSPSKSFMQHLAVAETLSKGQKRKRDGSDGDDGSDGEPSKFRPRRSKRIALSQPPVPLGKTPVPAEIMHRRSMPPPGPADVAGPSSQPEKRKRSGDDDDSGEASDDQSTTTEQPPLKRSKSPKKATGKQTARKGLGKALTRTLTWLSR
ncbi:hypothetical protein OF83DRAFT_1286553 [Amylostereum chailletii]|nr:hypothetical protein OF83DRAFT_1286553 [Amylostereum chailletii]